MRSIQINRSYFMDCVMEYLFYATQEFVCRCHYDIVGYCNTNTIMNRVYRFHQ